MNKNPWILFLYRVCQIGQVVGILALILITAVTGFMVAPTGLEMYFAVCAPVLTVVFLIYSVRRENSAGLHPRHL